MVKNAKLLKNTYHKGAKISKTDRAILHSLETVVEGIAEAFGTNCEVVLHSLEDLAHACIKIENGYVTGRKVGSPLTDFAMEILEKADSSTSDVIGSYYGRTDDGRPLKSVTMLIRSTSEKPIGFVCINIDLSVPLLDFLKEFSPVGAEFPSENAVERYPSTVNDLVSRTVEAVMTGVSSRREVSPSEKNRVIVEELCKRGMFNVKGAIDMVAKQMGISRYTVYNYIRDARVKGEG